MHPNYRNKRMNHQMDIKNQLFSVIEPSLNLKVSIINRIKKEEMKRTVYRMVFGSFLSLVSVSTLIIFAVSIIKDAYQSGLSEYLSLLFSDGASLTVYWQTYMMSIVESLPIIPITIAVASIGVFVWSMNMALVSFKNTKSVFYKVN